MTPEQGQFAPDLFGVLLYLYKLAEIYELYNISVF
jgi:hypothetical protein